MVITTRRIFGMLIAIFTCTFAFIMPATAASYAAYERAPLFELWPAYLDPLDEVRMQAALLGEQPAASSDANLNRRLRDVDIRTALQDTLRLHWDLG